MDAKWALAVAEYDLFTQFPARPPAESLTWLEAPAGKFYADPFFVSTVAEPGRESYMRIWFEVYEQSIDSGHIGECRVRFNRAPHEPGQPAPPNILFSDLREVLRLPHHLSYPVPINAVELPNLHRYIVPEQASQNKLVAYRASWGQDGEVWDKEIVLLSDVPAVDATLFPHDNHWYMFVSPSPCGARSELHLYHADKFAGPWKLHPKHPAVAREGSARCGGGVVKIREKLYRPAQVWDRTYGSSLQFYEITAIGPDAYEETLAGEWLPYDSHPEGLHHASFRAGMVVLDAKRLVESL